MAKLTPNQTVTIVPGDSFEQTISLTWELEVNYEPKIKGNAKEKLLDQSTAGRRITDGRGAL